ncbi:MAG: hypothetical protein AAGF12_43350 [Myxococcota bacterium]
MCLPRPAIVLPDPGACTALPTDYAPCLDDMYPECVSDNGEYVRVEETISTIARVEGYERMADLIFDPMTEPTMDDFLMARLIYQEDEGLDSRVVRRYDPHFDVPDGTDCTADGTPAMFPDYCVGPALIQPIILDAFMLGVAGTEPSRQAGRIDGALLWFLYASTYKESLTCTTKAKDCDSAFAYYTGGRLNREGIGLAGHVRELDPYAHDRAWDGLLAVRCWRDLDPGETAQDLALRERARTQYDRAVLDGVAAVVIDRFERLATATGASQAYYWGFLQALGPALDRGLAEADMAAATTVQTELAKTDPSTVDTAGAIAAIQGVFTCP